MATANKFYREASRRVASLILFGNYFLALCIVALSFETTLKNGFSIHNGSYYAVVFFSVVLYYTYAYINESGIYTDTNPRSKWYYRNRKLVFVTQIIYTILVACLGGELFIRFHYSFRNLNPYNWLLLFLFPATALLYYGAVFPALFRIRLRNIAWLKPFLIGFVCTGAIVIYPMIFYSLQQH